MASPSPRTIHRLDDLARPDRLRVAVASGEPVVVLADETWFPRLHEAAATCGRLHDVVPVRTGAVGSLPPRPPVRATRLDVEILGLGSRPWARVWSPLTADATWDAPFGSVEPGDGWTAAVLHRMSDLEAKGGHGPDADGIDGLAHCVAGYAASAMAGESVIVSLRRAGDRGIARASTAELAPASGGTWRLGDRTFALRQHRGPRNAAPPPRGGRRVGTIAPHPVRRGIPSRAPVPAVVTVAVHGEARDRALAVHASWRRILPARLARLAPGAILAEAARTRREPEARRPRGDGGPPHAAGSAMGRGQH